MESGRIPATLIRLLGDFDLAEESRHEAFAAALNVDGLRRRGRFDASWPDVKEDQDLGVAVAAGSSLKNQQNPDRPHARPHDQD